MAEHPLVLLVDASGPERLRSVVRRCGFRVAWSPTPEAALFELGQHDIAVVLAVLPLPGLGVRGLCQEVRLRGRVPVVAVTTDDDADWVNALVVGADDHVRSPIDERVLKARLMALIRRVRGPLSPRRDVRVGQLVVRMGRGALTIEPRLDLTAAQRCLLSLLAGHPGVVLSDGVLAEGVRAVHGPMSGVQLDAELGELRAAVDWVSGVVDAIERVEDMGWRLRTGPSDTPGHVT